jgi:hypothetical protein
MPRLESFFLYLHSTTSVRSRKQDVNPLQAQHKRGTRMPASFVR